MRVREETTAPPAKGSQEHLGVFRGIRKPLETGKVLGEGSKTYLIYVLRPSNLIQSIWFLHHHGTGRVLYSWASPVAANTDDGTDADAQKVRRGLHIIVPIQLVRLRNFTHFSAVLAKHHEAPVTRRSLHLVEFEGFSVSTNVILHAIPSSHIVLKQCRI